MVMRSDRGGCVRLRSRRVPSFLGRPCGGLVGDVGNSPFALSDDAAQSMGLPTGSTVPWREGIPDFSAYAVPGPAGISSTFEVPGLTGVHGTDRAIILRHMANQTGMSQRAIEQWQRTNKIVLHHAGGQTIQIVPTIVHLLHHTGGAQQLRGK